MIKDFCYLLRVRYSECDAQSVVFNARYADYADLAVSEFTRAIWGDYKDLLATGFDNQVVSLSINWKAPAHFDEVLAITVNSTHIGNSSYSCRANFYKYGSEELTASADIVYVMVSPSEHRKMNIPAELRQKLEQGAPGITIDHAGVQNTRGQAS